MVRRVVRTPAGNTNYIHYNFCSGEATSPNKSRRGTFVQFHATNTLLLTKATFIKRIGVFRMVSCIKFLVDFFENPLQMVWNVKDSNYHLVRFSNEKLQYQISSNSLENVACINKTIMVVRNCTDAPPRKFGYDCNLFYYNQSKIGRWNHLKTSQITGPTILITLTIKSFLLPS